MVASIHLQEQHLAIVQATQLAGTEEYADCISEEE